MPLNNFKMKATPYTEASKQAPEIRHPTISQADSEATQKRYYSRQSVQFNNAPPRDFDRPPSEPRPRSLQGYSTTGFSTVNVVDYLKENRAPANPHFASKPLGAPRQRPTNQFNNCTGGALFQLETEKARLEGVVQKRFFN